MHTTMRTSSPPTAGPVEKLSSTAGGASADRLVTAAAKIVSDLGLAGASARAIAAHAGAAPSAINYNFGAIEQLLSLAFRLGVAKTALWLEARRGELLAAPRSPADAPFALEFILLAWTRDVRPLALLYQEALATPAGQEASIAWGQLWRDFWVQMAQAFELGEADGQLMHLLFEFEALYQLSTWSPALEHAALREICGQFGAVWLGLPPSPITGALVLAERTAGARSISSIAPTAIKIIEAAAAVVRTQGLRGLTHRAVAAYAGVTTGAVTHHFRTIEDLVAGAIRGQVLPILRAGSSTGASSTAFAKDLPRHQMRELFKRSSDDGSSGNAVAVQRRRLFLAALRRPELAGAGAVIRFAHGVTTRDALDQVFEIPADALPLQAAIFSRLLCALPPANSIALAARDALAYAAVDRLFDRLPLKAAGLAEHRMTQRAAVMPGRQ